MVPVSRVLRRRAFDAYAANLSLYHPHVRDQFLCPMCRKLFGLDALEVADPEVTVAHVVPQAAGGRAWTLTCKRCNNEIGSRYDSHLVEEHRFAQWRRGERPLPARLRSGTSEIGVEIDRSDAGWTFHEIEKQTDPAQSSAFFERLQKCNDFRFTATTRTFSIRARRTALIYSAFLMMFRMFGYEYVLLPEAEQTLRALHGEADPDELRAAVIVVDRDARREPASLPSVSLLVKPAEFRCFAVTLAEPQDQNAVRVVALKGFGPGGQDCHRRILASDGNLGRCEAKEIEAVQLESLAHPKSKWYAHRLWRHL